MSVAAWPGTIQDPELRRLRALYKLLVSLGAAHVLQDVYDAAIASVLDATSADRAAILIFNEDGVLQFKAAQGLSVQYQAALTGHSAWVRGERNARPLVVPDAARELSLAPYRDLLAIEGIRALAFIPLALDAGVFGKLVLYYCEQYECTGDELEIAQAIANHISLATARQQAEQERMRTSQRLQAILDNSPAVIFLKDRQGRYQFVNRRHAELFGSRERILGHSDAEVFPPDFAERFRDNDRAVIEARGPLSFEETAPHPDGVHTYLSIKFPVEESDGTLSGVCGIATDISQRKRLEEQLMLLLEASGSLLATPNSAEVLDTIVQLAQHSIAADGYAVWRERREDGAWSLSASAGLSEEFVRTAVQTTAYTATLPAGPLMIPDVAAEPLLQRRQEALRREGVRAMLLVPLDINGRAKGTVVFYWKTHRRFTGSEARLGATIGNLAASALATAELYDQQTKLRNEAEAAERRASFLARAGLELASSLDYQEMLARVARLAIPDFADWAAVDILDDTGALKCVAVAHSRPEKVAFANEFYRRYRPGERGITLAALRAGKSITGEVSDELIEQGARDAKAAADIRELRIKSYIVVPMLLGERRLGTVTFATAESGRVYGSADLETAEELARRAAVAIDQARLHREVLEREEWLSAMIDTTPDLVKVVGPDGTLLRLNPAGVAMLEAESAEQVVGANVYEVIAPDFREKYRSFNEAICRGERGSLEFDVITLKGRRRKVETHAAPMRRADGSIVHLAITLDVTERKHVEDALRHANQDLEQFAFSASHDLQEPLRSVNIYSELLERGYGDKLEGPALQYLKFLRAGATRMQTLLRDLLKYTQATRFEAIEGTADAGEVLAGTLADMAGRIEETGAQITVGPLPSVAMPATPLQQVFQNLLSNALKYRRVDVAPVVHVSAENGNGNWVFSVRDNGIGIEPEFREKIFGLFKRLHTSSEYSGTGLGLAICQRIVERYHGRIWVELEPGEGSTFRFTLPA